MFEDQRYFFFLIQKLCSFCSSNQLNRSNCSEMEIHIVFYLFFLCVSSNCTPVASANPFCGHWFYIADKILHIAVDYCRLNVFLTITLTSQNHSSLTPANWRLFEPNGFLLEICPVEVLELRVVGKQWGLDQSVKWYLWYDVTR